jgi:hypothetical protein
MDERLHAVTVKALRKTVAALQGTGHDPVAVGSIARKAWGSKGELQNVELLIPSGEEHRDAILGAARGEGLQQASDGSGSLHLRYTDAKLGGTVSVELIEATTPFHQKVLGRARRDSVLEIQMRLATCEDLLLWSAGMALPADREILIDLLRATAGRLDGAYLKQEAQAAGVFDVIKVAWQATRQQA